ncbi:hypothetical protein [Borrelia coriaceae]|uniref:Putative cytosolic protein n=1 Tax=Borrelia coriaceae ATCC 43381 TaxID=1408429 RepID=W5SXP7_9SPIR|nr:hypothetical protein [Borrelia coriaceae]AHH11662.1 Putative cytosolic protein [Borrelia coriaceae ATCC 43381]
MKKSIVAICILTLMCLFSCDINFLNELLGKARDKFLEENNEVEDLDFGRGNLESKKEKADVVIKNGKGVEINRGLQKQEDIDLSRTSVLTKEQENELVIEEAKANDVKSEVNTILISLDKTYGELKKSLLELENMQSYIGNAKFDFENVRKSSENGIDERLKINLGKAIDKVKNSRDIAIFLYKENINRWEHAKASAEHAKNSVESALSESKRLRSGDYYTIYGMVHYILDAKESLSKTETMFEQVWSNLNKLEAGKKEAVKDFAVLKNAHEALGVKKK